jgi:hypothetical protein
MKKNRLKPIRGMLVMFVFLTATFALQQRRFIYWGFDPDVLVIGNLILATVTLVSYLLLYRSLQSSNTNSFIRAMYLGFIIKFFVLVVAAFIYITMAKSNVNKPSLIACAAMYILYTFIEVAVLTKLLKQKKNA